MAINTDFVGLGIKSIQYGTIAITSPDTSATGTINAVDTTKAALFYLGQSNSSNNSPVRITLTNSTTVTATRGADSGGTATVSFMVLEFQ